jgi:hypothetical protein
VAKVKYRVIAVAISVLSVSGLAPTPSPLTAQDIEIDYENDLVSLTYRRGFGATVAVQTSIDLISWMTIQGEGQVIAIDSAGELIASEWEIGAITRLFFRLNTAIASNVTLGWDAPLDPSVTGYRLHYGTASNNYTKQIDVGPNTQAKIFLSPSKPVWYFAVTAYNAAGVESPRSNELRVDIH